MTIIQTHVHTLNKNINATFYCDKPRHTCVLIIPFNQHPVRWMGYLGKGEVLTNTDLNKFVNKI